nr:hypothetical protein [Pseudoalteromonas sp. WY3]
MAEKVINRAIQTLYMPKKQRFIYQKNKYFTNKVDYVRWTQAWVYFSFAYFNRQKMNSTKNAVIEQL